MKKLTLIATLSTLVFLTACSTRPAQPAVAVPTTPATSTITSPVVPSATYTFAQVKTHSTTGDCWTTIGSKVYNVTPFFGKHKGGDDKLILLCGKDGTTLFTGKHGSNDKAKAMLATLIIGSLK